MNKSDARSLITYSAIGLVSFVAFFYPFVIQSSAQSETLAHANDAPIWAAILMSVSVMALVVDISHENLSASSVALLGLCSAVVGVLRFFDLPGGGNAMFFFLIIAAGSFGPRFGFQLGIFGMAASLFVTGGFGPWMPFEMIAAALIGVLAGVVGTQFESVRSCVFALALFGWFAAFVYGALTNLWFWPITIRQGPLAWQAGASIQQNLLHYWRFYLSTSAVWDAAGAFVNAILILALGTSLTLSFNRFSRSNRVVFAD